jgi:hypothetical protein
MMNQIPYFTVGFILSQWYYHRCKKPLDRDRDNGYRALQLSVKINTLATMIRSAVI